MSKTKSEREYEQAFEDLWAVLKPGCDADGEARDRVRLLRNVVAGTRCDPAAHDDGLCLKCNARALLAKIEGGK